MNQWRKGIAQWAVGDVLYLSVPFTWLVAEADKIGRQWKGKVVAGGPGLMRPTQCPGFEPVLFHNPLATFTSRGCPNRCPFCAVHEVEPEFQETADFRPAPIVCDNNFTATSRKHQERVIEKLRVFPLVDFNQGLQASLFTPELADLLGRTRCRVRFAFDQWGQEGEVKAAIDLCRARATKDIGVYCLIGFDDDPDSAVARLELVRSWGIRPNPMRYQPLDAVVKNSYVHQAWTEQELSRVARYYSRLRYFEGFPFEEYKARPAEQMALIMAEELE